MHPSTSSRRGSLSSEPAEVAASNVKLVKGISSSRTREAGTQLRLRKSAELLECGGGGLAGEGMEEGFIMITEERLTDDM